MFKEFLATQIQLSVVGVNAAIDKFREEYKLEPKTLYHSSSYSQKWLDKIIPHVSVKLTPYLDSSYEPEWWSVGNPVSKGFGSKYDYK